MVTFEESRKSAPRGRPKKSAPRRDSRGSSRRDSGSRSSYGSDRSSRGRDSGRSSYGDRRPSYGDKPRSSSRGRRDFEMTRVECSLCGTNCEVPFKPTNNKPVYCDGCFAKKGAATANKISENDLDIINEKLNKIMKALKIE